jgi:uncharacterized membrane protein YphA (DoxX/SURF4 family)
MVLRALLAAVFVLAGWMKLAAFGFEVRAFEHFGYAPWFMYAIGALEAGAGLALLSRRAAAPAALLLGAVMVGAAASHLRAGDGVLLAMPALALLALLAVVGAARRGDLLTRSAA